MGRTPPLVAALALVATGAFGEEPPARPRIGLALGGGSAPGIAHVGVLRWLEEHRVPVDLVAGTSVGGLVGGAYATGLSAAEIQDLLRDARWDLILGAEAPYPLLSYRRKEDAREYPVKIEVGLRHGLRFPSGLSPGHEIGVLLSRIALPYSDVADLDELPIPFRAVATDVEKGESIALGRGPLGAVLRAAMAIPGVFDPVRLHGRLLCDGSILDNVPVDVVKDMGAEVVIAVKVTATPPDRPSESRLGLGDRLVGPKTEDPAGGNLRRADLVILPDLARVASGDYRRSEPIAALGYQAAAAHAEFLLRFALDEQAWMRHRALLETRRRRRAVTPAFVEVTGAGERATEPLRRWMAEGYLGRTLDLTGLETDLERIVGSGRYASASYSLARRDGREGLEVRVREKSDAPPFLRFALDVRNDKDDFDFTFGTRLTLMDVAGYGSEWRFEGSVGSRLGGQTELLEPLGRGGAFVAPRLFYLQEKDNFYRNGERIAAYERGRTGAGADLGWILGRDAQLRVGYQLASVGTVRQAGDPMLPRGRGGEQLARFSFVRDGSDHAFFPRRGVRYEVSSGWYLEAPEAEGGFGQAGGAVGAAWPFGREDRALVAAEAGSLFGGDAPPPYLLTLGGPFRLSAFGIDEFRGRGYALGRAGYLKSLTRLPDLAGARVFLLGLVEVGSAFDRLADGQVKICATAGFAADTLVGPFFLGASVGSGGAFRVFVSVGPVVQ